jgi:hypothetical protein
MEQANKIVAPQFHRLIKGLNEVEWKKYASY